MADVMKNEEHTKRTPKPQDIHKMTYQELVEYATELGIQNAFTKNKRELMLELGGAPPGAVVYDRAGKYTPQELDNFRLKNMPIPGKTVYYEADDESIWRLWEKHPLAFNNYDLTDELQPIRFVFKKQGKCFCGYKFNLGKRVTMDKFNEGVVESMWCPDCGRKIVYVDVDAP